jgi:hypothetical protein
MAAYTSTTSGDWSADATWVGSGVPGDGDTATIAAGHTVTVSTAVTVGTAPGSPAAVVTLQTTGALTISSVGSLTIKGCLQGEDGNITVNGGGTLTIEVGTGLTYWIRPNLTHNDTGKIVPAGTTSNWAVIQKTGLGTATIDNGGFFAGGRIVGTGLRLKDFGSASVDAVGFGAAIPGEDFHLTAIGSKTAAAYGWARYFCRNGFLAPRRQAHRHDKYKPRFTSQYGGAITTGSRLIERVAFDKVTNILSGGQTLRFAMSILLKDLIRQRRGLHGPSFRATYFAERCLVRTYPRQRDGLLHPQRWINHQPHFILSTRPHTIATLPDRCLLSPERMPAAIASPSLANPSTA